MIRRLTSPLLTLLAACAAGLLPPAAVPAKEAEPVAPDPAAEARMRALALELRCLVCQNQTIADSEADLAGDLRRQILEQIAQGRSDEQIKDYMVERYGDFILYRPPVKGATLVLWFGPGLVLVGGLAALVLALRRRNARLQAQARDQAEEGGPYSAAAERWAHELLAHEHAEKGGNP